MGRDKVMAKARRAENKGLPKRWTFQHGAYYYYVPKGREAQWDGKKLFRLGTTQPEAYRVWSERMENPDPVKKVNDLLDRYMLEVVPTKAAKTQTGRREQVRSIRAAFGHMTLEAIEPQHVYKYYDSRAAKVSARREIALLSHALTKAVQWGYIRKHPFKGEIRLEGEKARERYVEDWEVVECLALPAVRKRGSILTIQAYIRLKLLTGLRRGDLLRLRMQDFTDDGIKVVTRKTGKPVVYEWTDALRAAVAEARAARPVDISPYLFCTKKGASYMNEKTGEASGWNSMWQRFMERVLDETRVTERFTEHDLRAKCASDAATLEHAQALLTHADGKLTQRVYRRKPERVKPLR